MITDDTSTTAAEGPVQRWVGPLRCSRSRCEGEMVQGLAMHQTYSGVPDFPGGAVVTMSHGGPGRLIGCWKCAACGWSVTAD